MNFTFRILIGRLALHLSQATVRTVLGLAFVFSAQNSGLNLDAVATALMHERLRVINNFKKPEDVVAYYVARDSSGFIWSGMLDAERKAFTTWAQAPTQDTFFVAKSFDITSAKPAVGLPGMTEVTVKYNIVAISDTHGTRIPVTESKKAVTFFLQKFGNFWKIAKPLAHEISPVVLEAKFPMTN